MDKEGGRKGNSTAEWARKLVSEETWTSNDFNLAGTLLRRARDDLLLQRDISHILPRLRARHLQETKMLAETLISKGKWTFNDLLSAEEFTQGGLLQTDISQRLQDRLVKETKLWTKELLEKKTWKGQDMSAAYKLTKASPGPEDLQQTDINTQRLRERYDREAKEGPERLLQHTSKTSDNSNRAERDVIDTVPEEIDDDPYSRHLYTKALQDGKETDRSIRINVVGNFSQGKTTLVRRLVGENIDGVEKTNGIDIDRYTCKKSEDGNLYCVKPNTDDNSRALHRLCMIASLLEPEEVESTGHNPDINDTINAHEEKINELMKPQTNFQINDEILSLLRQMRTETRRTISETENEIPTTFDIWDFGGQYIFYATHTLFHSKNAIYLLVMDVSRDMGDIILDEDFPAETGDRNMEYFIKFWMNSIHSFVRTRCGTDPPVILVGTHIDTIPGDENAKQERTEGYFEKVRKLFDKTDVLKHIHSKDFAVDNMSLTDIGIESLRKEIIQMGTEKAAAAPIPAKWIPLEEQLHKRRNENIIQFDEVKKIDAGNVLPLEDEVQIKLFLQYHHSKGNLFYFDEDPVSKYVVINPQYLIDAFKCIITSERFCKKDPKIRPLWNQLVTEARLEDALIDFQWRRNEDKHFMDNRTVLLYFLEKHYIISEVMKFDEQCQTAEGLGWYIVPSLLKNQITQKQIEDFLQGKEQSIIRIALVFENSAVIPTICHRMFAAAISRWGVASFHNQLLLFEDCAVFRLDLHEVGITKMNLRDRAIELQVVGLGRRSVFMGDTFRRFIEAIVNNEFRKFNTIEDLQPPFRLCYRCNHKSHGIDGSDLDELSSMKSEYDIPCPNLENHTIPVAEAKSEWFLEDKIRVSDIPKKEPSEKQLSKISRSIGENWEILGVNLGLTKVQIDLLREDNRTAAMKRFGMLVEWRKQQADRATIDVFVAAIKKTRPVRIDWDIIRNVIDEMK